MMYDATSDQMKVFHAFVNNKLIEIQIDIDILAAYGEWHQWCLSPISIVLPKESFNSQWIGLKW